MPGFISPQLATLKMKAPSGAQWIHEVKYDGYRIQLHIDHDDRKAFTRNGHNWINRFSIIAGAFNIPGQAIVDGEAVVIHDERTNFSELQADLGRGDQDRLVYFAFDLLWLDGKDLRRLSQLARKELLKQLIDENGLEAPIFYSEHHDGDGQALFEAASKLNYEGIVSKRVDAPYRSERVEVWQKIKTVQREKFPVVGFIKDPSGVAALYLGKKEGKELVYMGKVGTGWSRTTSGKIRDALDTVVSRSKSSQSPSRNRRPHGSSRSSTPTSNTATSPPKACCEPVLSRGLARERGVPDGVFSTSEWSTGMPDRVTQAVKEAQAILARYVEPGPRDCRNTINDLLAVLDDERLVQAMEEEDERQSHQTGPARA